MGVSPQQTWRGSYLDNTSHPQTKSACMKIINGAIIIFGISYLLYVLVVAIRPMVQPAHNAVKLRVHLRSGTGTGDGANRAVTQQTARNVDGSKEQLKLLMPGHNQAPSLQTGLKPELEALGDEGAGKISADSALAGGQAASKEGKAFQQPLKQKGSGTEGQPGEVKEARKEVTAEEGKKGSWKTEGSDGKEAKVEKELMISQQQREQLKKQLEANPDRVSQAK